MNVFCVCVCIWKWWNYLFALFPLSLWHFRKNERKSQRNNTTIGGGSDTKHDTPNKPSSTIFESDEEKKSLFPHSHRSSECDSYENTRSHAFICIQFEWMNERTNELRESINRLVNIFYFIWLGVLSKAAKPSQRRKKSSAAAAVLQRILLFAFNLSARYLC